MTPEQIFSLAGAITMPGWLLLVFLPRWRFSARLVCGAIIPAVLGVLYVGLFAVHGPGADGGFGSLEEVRQLFSNPSLLLAGWIHYLAFDLFVGAWEVRDAQRHRIPHLVVVPCLALTLMLGPTGLLVYLAVRAVRAKTWDLGGSSGDPAVVP